MRGQHFFYAVALAAAVNLTGVPSAGAAEGTVQALSSWEARGQVHATGPNEAMFVGTLSGVVYVKDEQAALDIAALDTALITCPASVLIDAASGSQRGSARCVILTPDGERIYARFECSGQFTQGCNGDFEITGGTGDREKMTGGGPIQLKSAFAQLLMTPGAVVEQSAVGLAVWPKLNYRIP